MAAVRVASTMTGFSWGGTLRGTFFPGGAFPSPIFIDEPNTGFDSIVISGIGGAVTLQWLWWWGVGKIDGEWPAYLTHGSETFYPGDSEYDTSIAAAGDGVTGTFVGLFEVIAQGGWTEPGESVTAHYACAFHENVDDAEDRYWVTQLDELELDWSIWIDQSVVKRSWSATPPIWRLHMHPTDAHVVDAWYVTPASTKEVSIGLATLSTAARRTAFPGQTDAEIGDEAMAYGAPNIAASAGYFHGWDVYQGAGQEFASITFDDGGFTGRRCRSSGNADIEAFGSGNTMTWEFNGAPHGTHSGGLGFGLLPSLDYAWAGQWCRLYHDTEGLDPEVWAGFGTWTDDVFTAGKNLLSQLPDSSGEVPHFTWSGGTILDSGVARSPRNWERLFHLTIDEDWAGDRLLSFSEGYEDDDGNGGIQDDLYILSDVEGVNDQYNAAVVTLTPRESAILPLVARPTGADTRWIGGGGVTVDPDAQETWTIPPGTTAGTVLAELVTRYWERLARVAGAEPTLAWRAGWVLRTQAAGIETFFPGQADLLYAEDVFSWKDHGRLRLGLLGKPWAESWTLLLTVTYSTVEITDPYYTDAEDRLAGWSRTRTQQAVHYTVTLPAGEGEEPAEPEPTVAVIDLLCPNEGEVPWLFVVDEIELSGLVNSDVLPLEVTLTDLSLVNDPTEIPDPDDPEATLPVARLDLHSHETPNFYSEWEDMVADRDGALQVTRLPNEPWRYVGPEGPGSGYVEPLVSTVLTSWLHTARPRHTGLFAWFQGFNVVTDTATEYAWLRSYWKGANDPEILTTAWQYFLSEQMSISGAGGLPLPETIRARDWTIARGHHYNLRVRKVLGGTARGLLRTADGLQRITNQTAGVNEIRYLVWRRIEYLHGNDGIPHPGGSLPAADSYLLHRQGALGDLLDPLGVCTLPGLEPSASLFHHPTEEPDEENPWRVVVTYYLAFWQGDGWDAFDLDDSADYDAFQADPRRLLWATFVVASRQITPLDLKLFQTGQGVSLCYTPWGAILLARDSGTRWPDEGTLPPRWPGEADAPNPPQLYVDLVSRWVHGGGLPELTSSYPEHLVRPEVLSGHGGAGILLAEDVAESTVVVLQSDIFGDTIDEAEVIAGYSHAAAALDPGSGALLMVARSTADARLKVLRRERHDDADPTAIEWVELADLGLQDATRPDVIATPNGTLLVLRVESSTIHLHEGSSHGEVWEELA